MLELGIANFMMFFVIIVIGLIFVIAWIIKSETRIDQAKQEIIKLCGEIETYQREKLSLEEKISTLEGAKADQEGSGGEAVLQNMNPGAPESAMREMLRKNEALEKDNKRLKKELGEAKASLEEVYKALSSQG